MKQSKYKSYKGDFGGYGIERDNAILYDAEFTKRTADEIARLYNKNPNLSWYQTRDILKKSGFDIESPPKQARIAP